MNKLALSTAVLALVSGAAFAQTTPPATGSGTATDTAPTTGTGAEPTTGTGMTPAPLTGNDASPEAAPKDTGNEGGAPAMETTPGTTETMPPASDAAPANTMPADTATETMPGDTATAPMMTPPEGYAMVEASTLTGEVLDGATVYGRDDDDATEDDNIGKISEVVPAEGAPQQVIVDVGGFLGIGAKSVALTVSELSFFQETDGDTVRAYTTMTEDELKALPEYEM
ncbi:PRC-barrel domain-containing protein [Falsirhodobacter halotolerans]|uniref:PRC-barrel domain-containing protein n=1 Tax=Falsirhodobacter halotolerans TaxID=1146892 RepID=UPI001FD5A9CB|nr:PRC-barrel domain-containing protein [Falsirhodobacter halotolerans]MCJ8140479.1 PRC-barrel domain-containing protein [Falsirhodobacter halotolerans]